MTQEQVKECINYYNAFWPEKSLTDDTTLKLFAVKLLPLDFELAMKAIDDACMASPGFMPSVGQVLTAYQAADVARARGRGWVPGIGWGNSVPSDKTALASGSNKLAITGERRDRLMAILREEMHRYGKRTPAEQSRYSRERFALRQQAQREGRPYYTEIQERMRAEALL